MGDKNELISACVWTAVRHMGGNPVVCETQKEVWKQKPHKTWGGRRKWIVEKKKNRQKEGKVVRRKRI